MISILLLLNLIVVNLMIVYMLIFENNNFFLQLDFVCSSIQCEFWGVVFLNSDVGNICGIGIVIVDSIYISFYSDSVQDCYCLWKVGKVWF